MAGPRNDYETVTFRTDVTTAEAVGGSREATLMPYRTGMPSRESIGLTVNGGLDT